MKIVKDLDVEVKKEYQAGDLVETPTGIYVLVREDESFILRRLTSRGTWVASNGEHPSIDELFEDLDKIGVAYTHYSKDDFELMLRKKSK